MEEKVDTKTCIERDFKKSFEGMINRGDIKLSFLINNFKRTDIYLTKKKLLNRDYINVAAKSLFCNLQIGVYFVCNEKVAVFKRSKYDKNQRINLTSKFTILKAWSPKSFSDDDKLESLSKKVLIHTHSSLPFEDNGIAYTNVHDVTKPVAPYYIFIIYKVKIDDEEKLTTLNDEDSIEDQFVEWLSPNSYNEQDHSFDYPYYDPQTEENAIVYFDGAIDRSILKAIKDNFNSEEYLDLTRGKTIYFPRKKIIKDTNFECFKKSEIVLDKDKIKYQFLNMITKKNKKPNSLLTLNDILMLKSKWIVIGWGYARLIKFVNDYFNS